MQACILGRFGRALGLNRSVGRIQSVLFSEPELSRVANTNWPRPSREAEIQTAPYLSLPHVAASFSEV
jgi:hypothetical protein